MLNGPSATVHYSNPPHLISDLADLVIRADSTQFRERHKRFLSSQDDLGIIQELNRELDRIVMAFTVRR